MNEYHSYSIDDEDSELQNIIDTAQRVFGQGMKKFIKEAVAELPQFNNRNFICSIEVYIDEIVEVEDGK